MISNQNQKSPVSNWFEIKITYYA